MKDSQFFNDLCVSDISVISGIRPRGRTVDYRAHGRASNGILYVWEGEATFSDAAGRHIIASSGSLLFLPKHLRYAMTYTAGSTTFVLVNFEAFDKNGCPILLFDAITPLPMVDGTGRITKIMADFEICGAVRTAGAMLRRKELLYRLLGQVFSADLSLSAEGAVAPQIANGVRMLEQTYLENLPITAYAEASHLNVNSFRRIFQKQFGMSPVKYRNRLRVDRAKELLAQGDLTVSEVAYACGFENVGYFCRYYRRLTGATPSDTKKKGQSCI